MSSHAPDPRPATGDFEHWLSLLRDGSDDEKARARTEIGLILEARGQVEAAADAYLTNVKLRVHDRRPYERLAAICRAKGDPEWEARVLLAMQSVFAEESPAHTTRPARTSALASPRMLLLAAGAILALGLVVIVGSFLAVRMISQPGDSWQPSIGALPTPTPSQRYTPSGLPCYDPVGHFPEWADPEESVLQAALVAFGNTRYSLGPAAVAIWRVALDDPQPTLAGWMGAELAARHSGNAGPSLPEYVKESTNLRLALSSMYRAMNAPLIWRVTPRADWERLLQLPDSDCVGAMLRHPRNTQLVRLMSVSVKPAANP